MITPATERREQAAKLLFESGADDMEAIRLDTTDSENEHDIA